MSDKIKVVLADDNEPSREIMSRFLSFFPEFINVGEAKDGEELIELVMKTKPDLVLVDINMPKLNGIDAIKKLIAILGDIKFIFVTAYDEFAVEAFRLYAVDYVVKPVEMNRLLLALERAKKLLRMKDSKKTNTRKALTIRFNGSIFNIFLDDILFIEKIERKTIIHTEKQKYESYETLENLQSDLSEKFFQSHRSYIVNIESIYRISPSGNTYLIYFKNYEQPAYLARQKYSQLIELLRG